MAQQGHHYTYPCWGLAGWCVLYACTACGLAALDVVVQTSPSLAEGSSAVCPSPFPAEAPSFFCYHHSWLGRIAVFVICAQLCRVAGPSDLPLLGHENTGVFCGCGLAGTPPGGRVSPHVSLDRVTCPLLWAAALGAAQPCRVSLTKGGIAPASLGYDRLTSVAGVAGPRCLAGDQLLGCVLARLSSVVAMAPGDVCHGP